MYTIYLYIYIYIYYIFILAHVGHGYHEHQMFAELLHLFGTGSALALLVYLVSRPKERLRQWAPWRSLGSLCPAPRSTSVGAYFRLGCSPHRPHIGSILKATCALAGAHAQSRRTRLAQVRIWAHLWEENYVLAAPLHVQVTSTLHYLHIADIIEINLNTGLFSLTLFQGCIPSAVPKVSSRCFTVPAWSAPWGTPRASRRREVFLLVF